MSLAALQLAYSGPVYSGQYMPESDGLVVPVDEHPGNNPGRVVICHVPEEEGESPRTIEVSVRSLDAHLGHGDLEGACEDSAPAQ
jgi:hypothetical protein